ncbi:MAG: helix-turn-helix transcriptional regulator, partial [Myxococcota bacterium]
ESAAPAPSGSGAFSSWIRQATTADFRHLRATTTLLVHIEEGTKDLSAEQHSESAGPGQLVLMGAGALITVRNAVGENRLYRARVLGLDPEPLSALAPRASGRSDRVVTPTPELAHAYRSACEAIETPGLPEAVVSHRVLEPFLWLHELGISVHTPSKTPITDRVINRIEADVSHAWRVAEVAKSLAMSESTLRRHLQSEGARFNDVVREVRLTNALGRLQMSEDSVTDIAFACGFGSPSRFAGAFRDRFGLLPSAIRTS